jgi:hypothetical protein
MKNRLTLTVSGPKCGHRLGHIVNVVLFPEEQVHIGRTPRAVELCVRHVPV